MSSVQPILQVRGVSKQYGQRVVVDGISFSVAPGERVALTGPSGSGKTTLLNCLGGVDRPDAGEIRLGEQTINRLGSEALADLRRRCVGTVFQFFHLLPTLTVSENVELPLQLNGVATRERLRRVNALLEQVGLDGRGDALPSQLSGGEQQRVAVARALVHAPAVLLADEPTGNLDSNNGRIILDLLRTLSDRSHTALVMVTHSEEAAAICHRTLHLRDGRMTGNA